MRRLNDPGSLGIALTQARGGPFSTRRLSLIASVILGSGERRFHGGSDDAQRSGWVTFAGFKYQFVAARPDDSNASAPAELSAGSHSATSGRAASGGGRAAVPRLPSPSASMAALTYPLTAPSPRRTRGRRRRTMCR